MIVNLVSSNNKVFIILEIVLEMLKVVKLKINRLFIEKMM